MTRPAASAGSTPARPARSWRSTTSSVFPASRSLELLADAQQCRQAGAEQRAHLPAGLLVGFAEDVAAFGVPDEGARGAGAARERNRGGAGERPLRLPVDVLGADADVLHARGAPRRPTRSTPPGERTRASALRPARSRRGTAPRTRGPRRDRAASSSWRRTAGDASSLLLRDRTEVQVLEVEAEVHVRRRRHHRDARRPCRRASSVKVT